MGSVCNGYMCILLPWVYVNSAICILKRIQCSGVALIYCQLEEGVGSVFQCSGVALIYCQLEEGWGQSSIGICAFCYMWIYCSVVVLPRSMVN